MYRPARLKKVLLPIPGEHKIVSEIICTCELWQSWRYISHINIKGLILERLYPFNPSVQVCIQLSTIAK